MTPGEIAASRAIEAAKRADDLRELDARRARRRVLTEYGWGATGQESEDARAARRATLRPALR